MGVLSLTSKAYLRSNVARPNFVWSNPNRAPGTKQYSQLGIWIILLQEPKRFQDELTRPDTSSQVFIFRKSYFEPVETGPFSFAWIWHTWPFIGFAFKRFNLQFEIKNEILLINPFQVFHRLKNLLISSQREESCFSD